ncbi:hypothetical protein diail_4753 [Diaporthe ilicicola]|nr:hypothetical protein diail_4753 [Diaporthe ilicicola]
MEEKQISDETSPEAISEVVRSYIDCLTGPDLWRTLGSTLPICAQQLTGLAFLNTYASLFFKQSGFTNVFLVTTIMAILSLITATGLILATDGLGRRLVVFAASILCSFALLLVGVLGQVGHPKPLQDFLIFVACLWALGNNARADWGYDTAWLLSALGSLVCVLVWFFVSEPSQRNYAEMDEMYTNGVPATKMREYVTEVRLAHQQQFVEADKLQ